MNTLYLIRGVPGSGKSDLALGFMNSNIVQAVFEADQSMMVDGVYEFKPDKLAAAHSKCQKEAARYLRCGYSVAVSNTSTTEKEVAVYQKIAEECGAKFVSLVVENRHGGINIHDVPPEKIQQMKNRFSLKL